MPFAFHGWLYDRPDIAAAAAAAAVVGSVEGSEVTAATSLGCDDVQPVSTIQPGADSITAAPPVTVSAPRKVSSRVKFRTSNHLLGDISPYDPATYNLPELAEQIDRASLLRYINNPELAAREAIQTMAEKGWKHDDLAWHHIALLPMPPTPTPADSLIHPTTHPACGNEGSGALTLTVKPILIDLSHVSELEEGDTVESVVEEGMRDLMCQLR